MKKLLSAGFLILGMAAAFAASTVNPNIPTPGSALSSAPIRANFAATYNDINALQARFPVTAADGGFGSNISAQSGVPLFASGVPTFTGTTGTGNFARAASPTFSGTTVIGSGSVLNTPASLTLTNATGLPIGGLSGLGANVASWLATPSSANLAAAVTDETGTGSLVFNNVPVFIAPVLGAATGNSLALNTCVLGSHAFCATGTADISGAVTVGSLVSGGGTFTTLSASSGINSTNIGAATPGTGRFSALQVGTATFPTAAGSSGNVLTSDGTNWLSSAPASSISQTSGTWTPTYVGTTGSGSGYLFQHGSYIKTGNLVYVQWAIRGNAGTMATQVYIGALPFPVSTSSSVGGCQVATIQGWNLGGSYTQMGIYPTSGTSTLSIVANATTGTGYSFAAPAMMTGNSIIEGSCTYMTP